MKKLHLAADLNTETSPATCKNRRVEGRLGKSDPQGVRLCIYRNSWPKQPLSVILDLEGCFSAHLVLSLANFEQRKQQRPCHGKHVFFE